MRHLRRDDIQRLFPGGLAELAFAACADAHQRREHTVRVVGGGNTGLPARTQLALGVRMIGIAVQLDDAAVFDLGQQAAAPDAHLAHAGDVAVALRVEMPGTACGLRHRRRQHAADRQGAGRGAAQLEEISS